MSFSLERRHYVMFHALGIFGHHWSLLFNVYFHIYFFVYLESGRRFKILKFGLKFGYEVGFEFNLEGFFNKCLGSPCYLVVVSGGSFFLGGLNKDTRRCFLWCLQVSSSSSRAKLLKCILMQAQNPSQLIKKEHFFKLNPIYFTINPFDYILKKFPRKYSFSISLEHFFNKSWLGLNSISKYMFHRAWSHGVVVLVLERTTKSLFQ